MRSRPAPARSRALPLAGCLALLLAPACSGQDGESRAKASRAPATATAGTPAAATAGSLWSAISRDRARGVAHSSSAPWYRTAREAMPTTVFRVNGVMDNRYVSDLFVVARVTSVEGGRSYSWPNGPDVAGAPSGKKVHAFNASDADVSTVYITATVERSVARASDLPAGTSVRLGITMLGKADLKSFQADVPGTRIAALLVANERSAYPEDPDVFGILENGDLLGRIDDQDVVTFPAWERGPRDGAGALVGVPLTELLSPVTPIAVKSP
ncbi:MAG: hypothetical protein ABIM89_08045 [Mycobacteriales bacterium]